MYATFNDHELLFFIRYERLPTGGVCTAVVCRLVRLRALRRLTVELAECSKREPSSVGTTCHGVIGYSTHLQLVRELGSL